MFIVVEPFEQTAEADAEIAISVGIADTETAIV